MKIDATFSNKMQANWVSITLKGFDYHDQVGFIWEGGGAGMAQSH